MSKQTAVNVRDAGRSVQLSTSTSITTTSSELRRAGPDKPQASSGVGRTFMNESARGDCTPSVISSITDGRTRRAAAYY